MNEEKTPKQIALAEHKKANDALREMNEENKNKIVAGFIVDNEIVQAGGFNFIASVMTGLNESFSKCLKENGGGAYVSEISLTVNDTNLLEGASDEIKNHALFMLSMIVNENE